ncbi:hypothetical protein BKA93DRAFT_749590 [Sparassis latifolia]
MYVQQNLHSLQGIEQMVDPAVCSQRQGPPAKTKWVRMEGGAMRVLQSPIAKWERGRAASSGQGGGLASRVVESQKGGERRAGDHLLMKTDPRERRGAQGGGGRANSEEPQRASGAPAQGPRTPEGTWPDRLPWARDQIGEVNRAPALGWPDKADPNVTDVNALAFLRIHPVFASFKAVPAGHTALVFVSLTTELLLFVAVI